MPSIVVNDVELFYETTGDRAGPTVLLVCGLGVQMIDWPEHLVDPLVEAGCFVIRFDNRDIGLSQAFKGHPNDPTVVLEAVQAGETPKVGYTLVDMAADAAALLDGLNVDHAHVLGVSMGGMIVQQMAIDHPTKVTSLTSIMSTTGNPEVGAPSADAMGALFAAAPSTMRDDVIEHNLTNARIWASPGLFDEDRLRSLFNASWDRVDGPQALNTSRQLCAILASPPRDEALASVTAPTLVVHGTEDTLINVSGGQQTANCVPGAKLLLIDGMSHDLPPGFTPIILGELLQMVTAAA